MPDLHSLFEASRYSANALSVATALAALSILCLGAGVLWRGRRLAAGRQFFLLTVAAAGWLGAFATMYASRDAAAALAWARIGYFFGALIPAAVFHFATTLDVTRKRYRIRIPLFWSFCALVGATGLFTNALMPTVHRYSWGHYPVGRPFGGVIVLSFFIIIVAAIHVFWRMYRGAEGKARERAGALLLAFVLGSLGMFDYLPSVGVDLQPIG
ncbi:MAG TPA: histidine kinase N-terminal 7TM domain-containing protein, partial [Thermoanaerobaculia bacterium]|nr:histidine kinase N-terminal 7TM domain-containing protein [Thermoanaerobaculia bacterium]